MNVLAVETIQMQIPAIISCFATSLVISTYFAFKDLRSLRYYQIVSYIAVNDLIASIGAAFGAVPTGSVSCWFQGLVTNANYISSCFWTVVITYQLWLAVHYQTPIQDMSKIHLFCWVFPWVVTLLPLSTNSYGDLDDQDSWCFIVATSRSPYWGVLFWEVFSFYIWIMGSIVVMTAFLVDVAVHVKKMTAPSNMIIISIRKLSLYPISLILCWVPSLICDFILASPGSETVDVFLLNSFGNVVPLLQGIFTGLIFFSQNEIVREKWYRLVVFRCCGCQPGEANDSEILDSSGARLTSDAMSSVLGGSFGFRPTSLSTMTTPLPARSAGSVAMIDFPTSSSSFGVTGQQIGLQSPSTEANQP